MVIDTLVKKGCRQTGIVAIPKDWEVKKMSNVAPLQRGFDLPTFQLKQGPFPVVYSNGILNFHKKEMWIQKNLSLEKLQLIKIYF